MRFQIIFIVAVCCGVGQAAQLSEDTKDTKTLTVKQAQKIAIRARGDTLARLFRYPYA